MNDAMTYDTATPFNDGHATLTRDEFLQVFQELAGKFDENKRKASTTEEVFFARLNKCRLLANGDPFPSDSLKADHPLRILQRDAIERVKQVFNSWDKGIKALDTHARFKERLGDSLLIFVYGKVKAGKSSLGNYVARGCTTPPALQAGQAGAPAFFVQEGSGLTEKVSDDSIRRSGAFKVGEAETTSAIQGFQLPGLTWVDSPGLHSKHGENGELAQKYVDAADMILYLTSSIAPCKRSDLIELQALGRKEHNLAVLITGSDRWIEDIDENDELVKELAMKTPADRDLQLNYVRASLRQLPDGEPSQSDAVMNRTMQRAQVHSVSVAYAQKHPDAAGMKRSGMGGMLHDVAMLAQGAGVRDKLVRPLKNMRSFLHDMEAEHLPTIQTRLNDLSASIAMTKSQTEVEARQRIQEIALRIAPAVDELIERHAKSNDSRAFKTDLARAYSSWLGEARDAIAAAYAASLGTRLTRAMDSAIDLIPDFQDVIKKIPRRSTVNAKRGAALGGILSGLAATLVPGGVVVALGAAFISSTLGGLAGNKIGSTLDDTEIIDMVIGNNAQAVGAQARKTIREKFGRDTENTLTALILACYVELEAWLSNLNQEVNQVAATTRALLSELDAQIPAA